MAKIRTLKPEFFCSESLATVTRDARLTPQRIQLRRTKGWRKPEGAIVVARPSRWGNPFKPLACIDAGFADNLTNAHQVCIDAYRDWLSGNPWAAGASPNWEERRRDILDHLDDLQGHDLACWCPLDKPCHADVLLELANGGAS